MQQVGTLGGDAAVGADRVIDRVEEKESGRSQEELTKTSTSRALYREDENIQRRSREGEGEGKLRGMGLY